MAFHAYGRPKEDEVPTERKLKSKYHCSSEEMPVQQGPWELLLSMEKKIEVGNNSKANKTVKKEFS